MLKFNQTPSHMGWIIDQVASKLGYVITLPFVNDKF